MAEKIKVLIDDRQHKVKPPRGLRLLIRRSCIAALVCEGFGHSAEISVILVDDDEIHSLNLKHRNIDSSTDVLSFPLGEDGDYPENPKTGALMLGDIVISLEHAVKQAELYGHNLEREVAFLTVHSMLHLLGYDHVNGGMERVRMREKEEEVLTKLGLPRNNSYYMVGAEDDDK